MKSSDPLHKAKSRTIFTLAFSLYLFWLVTLIPPLFLGVVFFNGQNWFYLLLRHPRLRNLWGAEWQYVLKKITPLIKPTKLTLVMRLCLLWGWWWASVRYAGGQPYEYAWKEAEFLGNTYKVNQAVLIPRPETEELTTLVIKDLHSRESRKNRGALKNFAPNSTPNFIRILEIGTGSGVIAISLQLAFPEAKITAIDISAKAIRVAQCNSERILKEAPLRPHFIIADGFARLKDTGFLSQFDVLVSNPPYVGTDEVERMSAATIRYEPKIAFLAGKMGLATIGVLQKHFELYKF